MRLEKKEDFLFSRSKCPNCGKVLTWKELIPIVSFIIQKGKCRNCQTQISLRYPLVEIFTGIWVFLLAKTLLLIPNPQLLTIFVFLFYFLFLSIFFVLALYDLKTFLVNDKLILFGILVGIIFFAVKSYFNLVPSDFSYLFNYLFFQLGKLEPLFSAFFLSSIFLAIFLLTRGKGMGFGDVEVAFLIGLFLRPGDGILSITLAAFFGSVYGLYLILKNRKFSQPIPFVPFLFLGVLTTIFFGNYLTKFYFSLFNF